MRFATFSLPALFAFISAGCESCAGSPKEAQTGVREPRRNKVYPFSSGASRSAHGKPATLYTGLQADSEIEVSNPYADSSNRGEMDLHALLVKDPAKPPSELVPGYMIGSQISNPYEDRSNIISILSESHGSRSSYLIKYRSSCGFGSNNPLVRNHEAMNYLNRLLTETGVTKPISVKSLYLSPPVNLGKEAISTRGLHSEAGLEACEGSELRFQVIEKFGISLRDHIRLNGTFKSTEAFEIAIKVLDLLSILHKRGIAHGGISWGNVLYDHQTKSVRLIDFDRYYDPLSTSNQWITVPGAGPRSFFIEYWSPNELVDVKRMPDIIDDIYGVYELIGAMIQGDDLYMEMRMLGQDGLLIFKRSTNYVKMALGQGFIDKINPIKSRTAHQIHSAVHSTSKPDHENLQRLIKSLISSIGLW